MSSSQESNVESEIDNMILQYKNQLDAIKISRLNRVNGGRIDQTLQDEVIKLKDNPKQGNSNCNTNSTSTAIVNEPQPIYAKAYRKTEDHKDGKDSIHDVIPENTKIAALIADNLSQTRQIKEMTKEIATLKEYQIRCQRIENEYAQLTNTINALQQAKEELALTIKDYETKENSGENKRISTLTNELASMKLEMQGREKQAREIYKEKDATIAKLNDKISRITSEYNIRGEIIKTISEFIAKNIHLLKKANLFPKGVSHQSPLQKDIQLEDISAYLSGFDQLMGKLMKDNSELVNNLNKLIGQNSEKEENQKVKDLKYENSLLKSQLNSLLNLQTEKKVSSPPDQKTNNIKQRNLIAQKNKASFHSPQNSQTSRPEISQLEKIKYKIKDLECKIVEINKDEDDQNIISSFKEFRNRGMSP